MRFKLKNKRSNVKEKPKKKHRVLKFILGFILIIFLLVVLFVGGFVGYSVYKNGWGLKSLLQTAVGTSDEETQNLEEFKVLILGVSEDISAELTDTIMVASYNPKNQKAVLLSIPRDTFVGTSKTNATSYDKINAIYQKGGAEETLKKVNKLTGLNIENYIVISNNALVELVDEIGGVQFDVPIDMNYDSENQDLHIHLKAGYQKLSGEQAEGLVRFRKNNNGTSYSYEYGSDDYGRMKTQREFIKAVVEQTLKAKNITKVGNLIDIVKDNVKTNITNWDLVKKYIPSAIDFDMSNLETAAIPGESARIPAKTGLWFFLANETETKNLVDELYSDDDLNEENSLQETTTKKTNTTSDEKTSNSNSSNKSNIKIELLNGSGNSKKLTELTNLLKKEGYTVYKTGTTSTTSKTTIINKSEISDDIISDIKDILETGIVSKGTSESNKADITIIIGKDY